MAKKNPGLQYEDFKMSLENLSKNLSGEQLEKANKTLKKIEETVTEQKDIASADKVTLNSIEKSLSKDGNLEKALDSSLKVYKSSSDKIISKLETISKVSNIKDEKPATLKENLKAGVAGIKNFASRFGESTVNVGSRILEAVGTPQVVAKRAGLAAVEAAKSGMGTIGEILSTKEDYTIEAERYAKARKEANPERTIEAGITEYKQLQAKEKQIAPLEAKREEQKKYGFDLGEKDLGQLKQLRLEHARIDSRSNMNKNINLENVRNETNVSNEIIKEVASKKEADITQKVRDQNPEADNIISAQESISENSKQDLEITKQLLETTKESVKNLSAIKEFFLNTKPKDKEDPKKKYAPIIQKIDELNTTIKDKEIGSTGLGGIASLAGDLLGGKSTSILTGGASKTPSKPTLGGKILGGLKTAAVSPIGKIGGALAVATGAYSAYTGVNAASEEEKTKLAEIEEAKKSGKITEEQAQKLITITKETTVEKKGGAVGGGVGTMIGGALGTIAGGALGTVVAPGVGTIAGGVAGGVAGAQLGEAAGNWLGEKAGKAVNFFTGKKEALVTPMETVAGKNIVPNTNQSTAKLNPAQVNALQSQSTNLREQIAPVTKSTSVAGASTTMDLFKTSAENNAIRDSMTTNNKVIQPSISNNTNNNNTTSYTPIKSSPRADQAGSPLERYQSRISVY